MDKDVRARVTISGRVQGVYFRAETQRAAERIGVTGWVRNQPDGRVQAVFEGPLKLVDQAIQWCWKGSAMSRVADVEVVWEDHRGEFDAFSVTYL